MKIIDPHVHLFNLISGDYHWLKDGNEPLWADKKLIQRNFNEQDLALNAPLILAGFVHIEAGFDNHKPWRELNWLEQHCTASFKSIAFADVTQTPAKFSADIKKLKSYSSFIGIRYIFNDHAYTSAEIENINKNLITLANEALIFEVQLPEAQEVFEQVFACLLAEPNLTIIINHAVFPPELQEKTLYSHWLNNIKKLSQLNKIYIKCSGWEMVNRQYSMPHVINIIKVCLHLFGEHNVMLASNFPLNLFTKTYQDYWLDLYKNLNTTNHFSFEQNNNLFYKNAMRTYHL